MTDAERIAELEAALARYEALPKLDHPDTQTLADFQAEVERLGTLGTAMALYEQLCSATRLVAQLRRLQDELESQRARNAALESKFNTTELCLKHADGWIDGLRARHAALVEQNGNLQSIANQHLANGCRLTEERDQARARHAALVEANKRLRSLIDGFCKVAELAGRMVDIEDTAAKVTDPDNA